MHRDQDTVSITDSFVPSPTCPTSSDPWALHAPLGLSYVERFLQNLTLLLLSLTHLWYLNGFEDLRRPKRNVKTAVFFLTLASVVGWLIVDGLSIFLKYEEGRDPLRSCLPKNHKDYSQAHQDIVQGLNFFFNW